MEDLDSLQSELRAISHTHEDFDEKLPDAECEKKDKCRLPPEIWLHIINAILPSHHQTIVRSLILASPTIPIDPIAVYKHIRLRSKTAAANLNGRMISLSAADRARVVTAAQSFGLKTFSVDPYVIGSILSYLTAIKSLSLWIGPTFAPEHLDMMLSSPRNLDSLSLRFRPYLAYKSYYSFLKGAYFDSAIRLISSWPANPTFKSLSIIQDPEPVQHAEEPGSRSGPPEDQSFYLPHYNGAGPLAFLNPKFEKSVQIKSWAEPICFFNLNCLIELARSKYSQTIEHLRLRIPNRDVIHYLTQVARKLTNVRSLDICTTRITSSNSLHDLLQHFENLQVLALDYTDPFNVGKGHDAAAREQMRESAHSLGRSSATSGLTRAKEAEKAVHNHMRLRRLEKTRKQNETAQSHSSEASTSITINTPAPKLKKRKVGRSGFQAPFSLREKSVRNTASMTSISISESQDHDRDNESESDNDEHQAGRHYIVVSSFPTIRAISAGMLQIRDNMRDIALSAFVAGWKEGLGKMKRSLEECQRQASLASRKNMDVIWITLLPAFADDTDVSRLRDNLKILPFRFKILQDPGETINLHNKLCGDLFDDPPILTLDPGCEAPPREVEAFLRRTHSSLLHEAKRENADQEEGLQEPVQNYTDCYKTGSAHSFLKDVWQKDDEIYGSSSIA